MSLSAVYEQTTGLSGYVKDASGAAVPQAALKITNILTNVARTETTSGDGVYSFPSLEPGKYAMHVEAPREPVLSCSHRSERGGAETPVSGGLFQSVEPCKFQ